MKRNDFFNSTFGCSEDRYQCVDTLLCFFCQVGHQYASIHGRPKTMDTASCVIGVLLCPATSIYYPMDLRCAVADKYDLDEGCCKSMCCGLFCGPCSVCMTGRELRYRGINPGGFCCDEEEAIARRERRAASLGVIVGSKNTTTNNDVNSFTNGIPPDFEMNIEPAAHTNALPRARQS